MKYLGEAYKIADVQVGDRVKVAGEKFEFVADVVDPKNIKDDKNLSGDCDCFVYLIIKEVVKGDYLVGHFNGWFPYSIIKLENKTNNNLNNCPECNIAGEYINGAHKCPLCWKVW